MAYFAEGIAATAETGGDVEFSFKGWVAPVVCKGVLRRAGKGCFPFFRNNAIVNRG